MYYNGRKMLKKAFKKKQVEGSVTGTDKSKGLLSRLKPKGKKQSLIALVIVLLLFGGLAYWLVKQQGDSLACSGRNNQISYDAVGAMNPANTKSLEIVTDKIRVRKGYQEDPNCLYPIVTYYIYKNDAAKANENLSLLEKASQKNGKLSEAYDGLPGIDGLKQQVETINSINEQIKTNAQFFN